jgi:hypothetical protein
MPSTMSKMDNEWSVETPPRMFTRKRHKTDPEVKIKLTTPQQEGRRIVLFMFCFLQTNNTVDLRTLDKRREALQEMAVADLTPEVLYRIIAMLKQSCLGIMKTKREIFVWSTESVALQLKEY